MSRQFIRQALVGLAFSLVAGPHAGASTLAVNPVRISLPRDVAAASVTVDNESDAPMVVQLQPLDWSQRDGEDVLEPTRQIIATPPIFTLPPGGSQIVRVGLRGARDARRELTYRLYLEEIPPPPQPGFRGLQVALRVSIPVFVEGLAASAPAIQWRARRVSKDELKIAATNTGGTHLQVSLLSFRWPGSNGDLSQKELSYILAGQSREWLVKAPTLPAPGTQLHLTSHTDAGDLHADILLE